jgi:hypothetical protein
LLGPNETGKVEIILDTSRFVGKKTVRLRLEIDNGQQAEFRLVIKAESMNDPTDR